MYGLVNQAMRDLVVSRFGEARWKAICARAGSAPEEFVAMKSYPDTVTYGLVGAASAELEIPADQLLRSFGDFWITFTALEGYGEMMDLFGRDFVSCLRNLNGMHAHMGVMMPELQPPRFEVEGEGARVFRLKYYSKRQGLVPFVLGLLEGLSRKFGTPAEFSVLPRPEGVEWETFEVRILESATRS